MQNSKINKAKVEEAIMYAENDYGLMVHLEFDFYNTLVRKRTNGTWDKEKAIDLIAKYFVPRIIKKYKKEVQSNDISGTTMEEKRVIAKYFLNRLWEDGGDVLPRRALIDVKKGDKNKLLVMEVSDLDSYANRERVKSY